MGKRVIAVLLLLPLLLGAAGCGVLDGNIGTLLKTPAANNMQIKLRAAIDSSIGTGIRYVVPATGKIRSSFVTEDLDGDGRAEAVILYSEIGADDVEPKANLAVFAEAADGSWALTKQVSGLSGSVDYLSFADFNFDGHKDALVGWIMGDSAREVCAYDLHAVSDVVLFADAYNESRLFTDTKGNPFLFIAVFDKAAGTGVAKIVSGNGKGEFGTAAECPVSAKFETMTNIEFARISSNTSALVLDARQGKNAVTQLLFWDGKSLINPYYENEALHTAFTRETAFAAQDIDKDGITEFPAAVALPQLSQFDGDPTMTAVSLTNWSAFDARSLSDYNLPPLKYEFSCVMNAAMGYYYIFPAEWMSRVSVYYNSNNFGLNFYQVDPENKSGSLLFPLLRISREDYAKRTAGGDYYELRRDGDWVYAMCIAPNLTADMKLTVGTVKDSAARLILT